MKALITVQYATPDKNLHEELFVKVPFNQDNNLMWRMNMSFFGDPDGGEVSAYQFLQHLLPFRTPKMYFVDMSRATTNYIIVTEQIPFMPKGMDSRPYEIVPTIGKFQDFELQDACQPIYALLRAMARMIAWDKQGRFEHVREIFEESTYARMGGREAVVKAIQAGKEAKKQATKEQLRERLKNEMLKAIAAQNEKKQKHFAGQVDKFIYWLRDLGKNLFPADCKEEDFLENFRKQMLLIGKLSGAIAMWTEQEEGHDEFYGLIHPNLQIDNGFFWKDEEGMYHAGLLDWGGCGYYPHPGVLLNIMSTAQAQHFLEHEDKWFQCFVDEIKRFGGPEIDAEKFKRIVRLNYAAGVAGMCNTCVTNVFALSQEEEWKDVKDKFHEVVMDRWNIRCNALDAEIKVQVWRRSTIWQTVLDWAKEQGLPTDPY